MGEFPNLKIGDVLKLENIVARKNIIGWLEREFLVRSYPNDNQFILFPDGDWEKPYCPSDKRFRLTTGDVQAVKNLKKWYADIVGTVGSKVRNWIDDSKFYVSPTFYPLYGS